MINSHKSGILFALSAYLLWGFLPIYWKLVDDVPADTILAHRIIWSFVLMAVVVLSLRKGSEFTQACKRLLKDRKKSINMLAASLIISMNWLIFIWAVNSEHVIQASLGYYINPLVSILLGIIVLKERLSKRQLFSIILAAIGVLNLTFSFGVFPWVSILLAVTFALYGLFKKMVDLNSIFSLTIETMIVTPIALIYLSFFSNGTVAANTPQPLTFVLLIGTGLATAAPLLLFGSAVRSIPLSMIGFLQYLAPTIMLLLGVFLYEETFSPAHLVSFIFIWIALFIYMGSSLKQHPIRKVKHQH
ncbi:EamA family transporter RarD [Virgibacillus sp. W0181]|uniref:EamA family transporter RarD n=1 Tax=Virgibacillus sp. W0181 TaxID=3391581 RepID=UPI003F48577E